VTLVTEPSVRVPAPTPEERHRAAAWFRLVPLAQVRHYPWLTKLAIAVYALCVLGMFGMQERVIHQSAEAIPSPVAYVGPWATDRPLYHPGEVVRFRYRRDSAQGDLVLYSIDAWENAATGLTYPEPICGRFVERPGTEEVKQARELPTSLPPGTYRLRGWITAVTSRRSRPAGYVSVPFRVVAAEKKGR
jgi:hypothetical protein